MHPKTNIQGEYDRLFIEHYATILKRALQITGYDYELSEDLVQNIYVQLKINFQEGKFTDISSFDNYLYITLRNSYISYIRKFALPGKKEFSINAEEWLDNILYSVDPRDRLKVRDNVLSVCHFACLRKSTSISSSVLILRFFHGYLPSEIAKVLISSRNVVEARLASARREAVGYLNDPNKFNAFCKELNKTYPEKRIFSFHQDILQDIRSLIFSFKDGHCLSSEQLRYRYQECKDRISRGDISHIVSCPRCLDATNNILKIPPLEERHPLYTIGKEENVKPEVQVEKVFVRAAKA